MFVDSMNQNKMLPNKMLQNKMLQNKSCEIHANLSIDENLQTCHETVLEDGGKIMFGRSNNRSSDDKDCFGIECPKYGFQNLVFSRDLVSLKNKDGQIHVKRISDHNQVFFGKIPSEIIKKCASFTSFDPNIVKMNNAKMAALSFAAIGRFCDLIPYEVSLIISRMVYSSRNEECWLNNALSTIKTYTFDLDDAIHMWSVGIEAPWKYGYNPLHIMKLEIHCKAEEISEEISDV